MVEYNCPKRRECNWLNPVDKTLPLMLSADWAYSVCAGYGGEELYRRCSKFIDLNSKNDTKSDLGLSEFFLGIEIDSPNNDDEVLDGKIVAFVKKGDLDDMEGLIDL